MEHLMKQVIPVTLFTMCAGTVFASPDTSFEASRGTLPEDQCWWRIEDINPPMSYPSGVASGLLHLSTLGFAATGLAGGGVWWQRNDIAVDFEHDFYVAASVRILSAPDHSVNPQTGWPRPGYTLAVNDVHGRLFWVGLGSSEIFLSNTAFGNYNSPNTVTLAFNTTDAQHVYALTHTDGGTGATLWIDDVPRLTLPSLGPVESSESLLYFGDPTYWANSESHTAWVRACWCVFNDSPADFNADGTLDFFDYLDFISAFTGNLCTADWNADSVIDFFDYLDFIVDFQLG